jgi:hypothetical protein
LGAFWEVALELLEEGADVPWLAALEEVEVAEEGPARPGCFPRSSTCLAINLFISSVNFFWLSVISFHCCSKLCCDRSIEGCDTAGRRVRLADALKDVAG